MTSYLERHIKFMDNIRKIFGETNYVDILGCLKTQVEIEPDEDSVYLINKEIDVYTLLIERDEQRKDIAVQDVLYQPAIKDATNKRGRQEREHIETKREDIVYHVLNNEKNRILHSAIFYCIAHGESIRILNASIYREIAILCNSDENNVKATLSRIIKDGKGGLSVDEKQYYIMLLANKGVDDVAEKFPFLKYDHLANCRKSA